MMNDNEQPSDRKKSKAWLAALAVPVAVVGGVSVASAQEADVTDDGDAVETAEQAPEGRKGGRGGPGRAFAEALGLDRGEIRDALENGATIASLAEEQGVDIDTVIADIVTEAQARANEAGREGFDAEALTERLTAAANGEVELERRGGPRHRAVRGASEAVQDLLGLDQQEIHTALRDGQTLAQVAEEQGVSLDSLVSTIVDDIEERLAASDRGLPEDFDEETLTDKITARVNGERAERGGPGGPRGGAPAASGAEAV